MSGSVSSQKLRNVKTEGENLDSSSRPHRRSPSLSASMHREPPRQAQPCATKFIENFVRLNQTASAIKEAVAHLAYSAGGGGLKAKQSRAPIATLNPCGAQRLFPSYCSCCAASPPPQHLADCFLHSRQVPKSQTAG